MPTTDRDSRATDVSATPWSSLDTSSSICTSDCSAATLVMSVRPSRRHDRPDGLEEDPRVQGERPVLDVERVERERLVGRDVASTVDLPPPGQPGLHLAATAQDLAGEVVDLLRGQRARPHEAHITLENVDELWELVDAEAAQERAEPRDPGVVLDLEERRRGVERGRPVGRHRPELVDREPTTAERDSFLPEQCRTR